VNKPVQIAIIVACLAAAGYLVFGFVTRPSATANEGAPDILHFLCANPKCGHGFSWERGSDTGGREGDTCPDCNTEGGYRAAKCPNCAHYQALQGHGTYQNPCPECGKDMPPLREQE
jgi:hypothetical protein